MMLDEIRGAKEKMKSGQCFANYDEKAQECKICRVRSTCKNAKKCKKSREYTEEEIKAEPKTPLDKFLDNVLEKLVTIKIVETEVGQIFSFALTQDDFSKNKVCATIAIPKIGDVVKVKIGNRATEFPKMKTFEEAEKISSVFLSTIGKMYEDK